MAPIIVTRTALITTAGNANTAPKRRKRLRNENANQTPKFTKKLLIIITLAMLARNTMSQKHTPIPFYLDREYTARELAIGAVEQRIRHSTYLIDESIRITKKAMPTSAMSNATPIVETHAALPQPTSATSGVAASTITEHIPRCPCPRLRTRTSKVWAHVMWAPRGGPVKARILDGVRGITPRSAAPCGTC